MPDRLWSLDLWSLDLWSLDLWSLDLWSLDLWFLDLWLPDLWLLHRISGSLSFYRLRLDPNPSPRTRHIVFGPLGFYELVFILGIAFLLLGPRQLSVLSGNLGRTLREFYKATSDVRRQINAERAALEEEIRREQQPIQEAVDEIKKIDRTIRKETGGEWSRRNVLGQNEPAPQVKPQPLPSTRSSSTPSSESTADAESSAEGDSSDSTPRTPEIRTPRGATARGSLDPEPLDPETGAASTPTAASDRDTGPDRVTTGDELPETTS